MKSGPGGVASCQVGAKPAWMELGLQSIVANYEKEMVRGRQIGHDRLSASCFEHLFLAVPPLV
jgi:hypothetical protein